MLIEFYNRYSQAVEQEKVYGEAAVSWLYTSWLGKQLAPILCSAPISEFYGLLQGLEWSKSKVAPFVKKFQIPMDEFLPQEGRTEAEPYESFNQFFIRRFRPGKRSFPSENSCMGAFSEARYFGYEKVDHQVVIPVKGKYIRPSDLIGKSRWESTFECGPLLLARLCPVDYHRFHFPDDGNVLDSYPVHGDLHSVNPIALKAYPDIFLQNERHISILETEHFGKLAYIEVGAICVGKIVQSFQQKSFRRGDEKGYFLFGGSTVIVIGEPGRWSVSPDILKNTKEGRETYIHLGDQVANSL